MPLTIPDGCYVGKLRWRLTGDPEEMICTLGFREQTDTDRSIIELAEALYNAWLGAFEPGSLKQGWSLVGCDVVGAGPSGDHPSGSWDQISAGTHPAPTPPQNCAVLLKKKTAKSGHRNSGRMYLPPGYTSEEGVSPTGAISGPDLTVLQNMANQFFANLTDSDTLNPVGGDAALVPLIFHTIGETEPTPITQFVIDAIIATQRQRLRR